MDMDKAKLALTIAQIADEGAKACARQMTLADDQTSFLVAQIFCLALSEGALTVSKKAVLEGEAL